MVQEQKSDTAKVDIQTIIQIGFDVLNILADRFRREMGQEFDNIWDDCLNGLEGFTRELFNDIGPDKENQGMNIYIIKGRYDDFEGEKDPTIVLHAFAGLIANMITSIEKYLGEGLVEGAVQEAVKVLSMVGKYQKGMTIAEYFIDRLRETDRLK